MKHFPQRGQRPRTPDLEGFPGLAQSSFGEEIVLDLTELRDPTPQGDSTPRWESSLQQLLASGSDGLAQEVSKLEGTWLGVSLPELESMGFVLERFSQDPGLWSLWHSQGQALSIAPEGSGRCVHHPTEPYTLYLDARASGRYAISNPHNQGIFVEVREEELHLWPLRWQPPSEHQEWIQAAERCCKELGDIWLLRSLRPLLEEGTLQALATAFGRFSRLRPRLRGPKRREAGSAATLAFDWFAQRSDLERRSISESISSQICTLRESWQRLWEREFWREEEGLLLFLDWLHRRDDLESMLALYRGKQQGHLLEALEALETEGRAMQSHWPGALLWQDEHLWRVWSADPMAWWTHFHYGAEP